MDFIIIGGYSVIFHGYVHTTGGIEVWLKPDNTNKEKLLPVLLDFGFDESETSKVSSFDFTKHLVFSIGDKPEKIDFLTRINLVEFADAEKRKSWRIWTV